MVLAQPSNESARTLRVAVVGAGERGIELAAMVPTARHGARIVAVCDPSERSRDRALRLLGGPLISAGDHTALHPDVADVAIVASPDDTHARIAIDLLRAGIAVYLEKPMATTVEDADRVLEVARATGTPLYVGHNMRHEAMPKLMKSIIDDGQIGEVKAIWCRHFVGHGGDYYFKDWHADRSRSTGLLLQKAVHDIDFMHWLAGS